MFDIKNYFFKIMVSLGLRKKPERIGIKMQDSTGIRIISSKITGFDKAIDAKNIDGLDVVDTEIGKN